MLGNCYSRSLDGQREPTKGRVVIACPSKDFNWFRQLTNRRQALVACLTAYPRLRQRSAYSLPHPQTLTEPFCKGGLAMPRLCWNIIWGMQFFWVLFVSIDAANATHRGRFLLLVRLCRLRPTSCIHLHI